MKTIKFTVILCTVFLCVGLLVGFLFGRQIPGVSSQLSDVILQYAVPGGVVVTVYCHDLEMGASEVVGQQAVWQGMMTSQTGSTFPIDCTENIDLSVLTNVLHIKNPEGKEILYSCKGWVKPSYPELSGCKVFLPRG